ncbi:MAG: GatB/YqeY domain-containing protein [Planctomycetota bacterium]
MTELLDRITADVKAAMKARKTERLTTLRMLVSELKNAGIEKKGKKELTEEVASPAEYLSESEVAAILQRYLKQRREAMEAYRQGGRGELVAKEQAEIEIVASYLPRRLEAGELDVLVRQAIVETGAESPAQMGQVMKAVMGRVAGRADGKAVSEAVKRLLSS